MFTKIVGLFAVLAVCGAQKQTIKVYYESLCPDSQALITSQIYPALTGPMSLAKYVDLMLIPFGRANYTTRGDDVLFTCHHGPNECYGNKIQACAVKHIQVNSFQRDHDRESLTLEYINCLMKVGNNFPDSLYPGQKCATETHVNNWNVIDSCANSTDGSKYLQINGEETSRLNPPLTNVPTVTYGHQFDEKFQNDAVKDFHTAVCKRLVPTPKECASANTSAYTTPVAFCIVFITFVVSRLFN
jgi:hypothetical protein